MKRRYFYKNIHETLLFLQERTWNAAISTRTYLKRWYFYMNLLETQLFILQRTWNAPISTTTYLILGGLHQSPPRLRHLYLFTSFVSVYSDDLPRHPPRMRVPNICICLHRWPWERIMLRFSLVQLLSFSSLLFLSPPSSRASVSLGPSSGVSLGRLYQSPFSVEELLSLVLQPRVSRDTDLDPCKRDIFSGDNVGE